jgi:dipeptidyl aminopeptidase/acylaminoacyl peptidase
VHGYRKKLIVVGIIFTISITLGMLVTQEGRRLPLRVEQLSSISGISEFTWSPDGKWIAYVGGASGGFDIWIMTSAGKDARRVTSSGRYKRQPRWSKDGKWIAFIAVDDDGNTNLRVISTDGQILRQLTESAAEESDPTWSPDGKQIAFTQRFGARNSIMTIDVESSMVRTLADVAATELRWSPDGKWIAFVADLLQPRAEHRENADIFIINSGGGSPRLLTPGTPRFRDTSPDWAPDSRRIVYTSEESGFSNLYILDTQTEQRRALATGGVELLSPQWSSDGSTVAYVRHENSGFQVFSVVVENGYTTRISDSDGANGGYTATNAGPKGMIAWSPDGKHLAFTHSDPGRVSDIWVGGVDGTRPTPITDSMPMDLRRESRFTWPDRLSYRSFDGQEVTALVYKPKGARPPTGFPAVLYFRDALDGENAIVWDPIVQYLVSNGYVVFAPNVRGSGGKGRTYRELVAEHGGDHDVRDALFGLDRLSSESMIDTERVGVLGAGTGGFLTTATLIRGESRFKAAVSINGIVDAVTAASYPDTAEWTRYMIGGSPIENPMAYYERSLVNFVDKLRTPIIFLNAGHSATSPFQQLQQFAVQAEVKGRWYDYRVFDNEWGDWSTWRPANVRSAMEAIEAVFEKYLMGRERDIRLSRKG